MALKGRKRLCQGAYFPQGRRKPSGLLCSWLQHKWVARVAGYDSVEFVRRVCEAAGAPVRLASNLHFDTAFEIETRMHQNQRFLMRSFTFSIHTITISR